MTIDIKSLEAELKSARDQSASIVLEHQSEIQKMTKLREQDQESFSRKTQDQSEHHSNLLCEMKKNLEHEFHVEIDNINSINRQALVKEKSKANDELLKIQKALNDQR